MAPFSETRGVPSLRNHQVDILVIGPVLGNGNAAMMRVVRTLKSLRALRLLRAFRTSGIRRKRLHYIPSGCPETWGFVSMDWQCHTKIRG